MRKRFKRREEIGKGLEIKEKRKNIYVMKRKKKEFNVQKRKYTRSLGRENLTRKIIKRIKWEKWSKYKEEEEKN